MGKITDETLDRMSSELLSLADFTQRQVETDDRHHPLLCPDDLDFAHLKCPLSLGGVRRP